MDGTITVAIDVVTALAIDVSIAISVTKIAFRIS